MKNSPLQTLRLNPRADKRLRGGHHWIYSNEVDTQRCSLKQFSAGEQVLVESDKGLAMGVATVNPHTLICGRLLTRDTRPVGKIFLLKRFKRALALRERCFAEPFYRLVYGDSDGLSGLVVDRFGDVLVVQISSAGMEVMKELIVAALEQLLSPKAVLFKNDGGMRELEGLPSYVEDALGSAPDLVPMRENGTDFMAPIREGQKTGWFYDHRISRAELQKHAKGKRVLDLFSYIGGWGIQALNAGASGLVCVDSSMQALEWAHQNSELNGVADRMEAIQGKAHDVAQTLLDEGERFDVVVVDPPAFIKRRKDLNKGQNAYRRINELAIRLLNDEGLLVSASCSMHLERPMLFEVLRSASRHVDRSAQVISQGYQGPDHPIHPAILETEYLKTIFARVI